MVGQKDRPVDDRPAVIVLPLGPTLTVERAGYTAETDLTVCLSAPWGELQAILRAFRP